MAISIHHNNLKLTNRDYPRRENSRVSGEQRVLISTLMNLLILQIYSNVKESSVLCTASLCFTNTSNKSDSSVFLKQEYLLEKSFHKSIIPCLDLVKSILNKDRNLLKYIE